MKENLHIYSNELEIECRDYHKHSYNSTYLCHFMNTTDDCQIDDGFVNYLVFSYCSFDLNSTWIPILIMAVWLFILFVGLGVTADSFFCASLRVIADSLRLSQNIAGVTFLAFGNGAPDVFSAIAAISNSKDGDAGLAFGALFGAGVFVSTVIVGLICFIKPFYSVKRPLLRDIIFFMIAGFLAFVVVWDGKIVLWETLTFLILYVIYILVVVFGRYINQKAKYKTNAGGIRKNDFRNINSSINRSEEIIPENECIERQNDDTDYDEENEAKPLLEKRKSSNDENENESIVFNNTTALKASFQPFTSHEWKESNFLFKMMLIIKSPVVIILKLTIPLVDYEVKNDNWNKITILINCMIAPTFMALATKAATIKIFNVIPIWAVTIVIGVVLSFFVAWKTELNEKPKFHWIFAYLGFFVSVIWIYSIANEIVNLLTAFGVILNITNTILGLTFLAWGNSLSDLVADVFSAKNGFPNMGISACFGGPLFNILLGVGIPFTIQCIKHGERLIKQSFLQDMLALFLAISLCSSLIFIPLNNFYFSRRYGIYLMLVYAVFLIVCILIETGVIQRN